MKTCKPLFVAALLLAFVSLGLGQTTVSSTTLSAALTSSSKTLTVASATGISGRTLAQARGGVGSSTADNLTILYIDREAMEVEKVSSTTITVKRGAQGTAPAAHASAAKVWLGRAGYFGAIDRSGPCTAASETYVPVFNIHNGKQFNCGANGAWYDTTSPSSIIAAFCTSTVGSAETEYLTGAACSGATTSTTRYVVPTAGAIANLRVYSSAVAVGGTNKDVLTVQKNGSDSILTCTITAAAATCSDTTHVVAVAAGDVLTFKFVTATSDTASDVSVAIEKFQVQ